MFLFVQVEDLPRDKFWNPWGVLVEKGSVLPEDITNYFGKLGIHASQLQYFYYQE